MMQNNIQIKLLHYFSDTVSQTILIFKLKNKLFKRCLKILPKDAF